jgi:transposase
MDGMQDVRVRYRQELQRDKRIKYEEHCQKEGERKAECKEQGIPYRKQAFRYKDKFTKTGESHLELLARSRYLLFKFPSEWTESQRERSKVLFDLFPEIKYAYYLTLDFRRWYSKFNIGMPLERMQERLKSWYKDVKQFRVGEILNVKSTIERNESIIVRYFEEGATNAKAENLSSRIQKFYNINNGARDIDYFFFRIKKFFV